MLKRTLSTGEMVLFKKDTRELIVVAAAHAKQAHDWNTATALVKSGQAHHFDKQQLGVLTEALRHVVLLGGGD